MKRWRLLLVAFLIALPVMRHRSLVGQPRAMRFEPTGYTSLVNGPVAEHLCIAHAADVGKPDACDLYQEAGVPDPGNIVLLWKYAPHERAAYRTFERESALAFDRANPSRFTYTWQGNGYRAALLPGLHGRALPFSSDEQWAGAVTYRETSSLPRLISTDAGHQFVLSSQAPEAGTCKPFLVTSLADEVDMSAGCVEWRYGGELVARVNAYPIGAGEQGSRRRNAASEELVLRRAPDVAGTRVLLNGRPLPPDSQRRLNVDDWLEIQFKDAGKRYIVELEQRGVISHLELTPEGPRRRPVEDERVRALAEPVVDALNFAVRQAGEIVARDGSGSNRRLPLRTQDVRLTLDRFLQAAAQDALEEWMERERQKRGGVWTWRSHGRRLHGKPPRAGLTIIEAHSGQVLAAASYPTVESVKQESEAVRKLADSPGTSARDRRMLRYHAESLLRSKELVRNHNLTDHQIGSVHKPLFAATLAASSDVGESALSHRTQCVSPIGAYDGDSCATPEKIGGLPIGCALGEPLHGPVDFSDYLAKSCNRYLLDHGAAALHELLGPQAATVCRDSTLGLFLDDPREGTSFALWPRLFHASWKMVNWDSWHRYDFELWRDLFGPVDRQFEAIGCPSGLTSGPDARSAAPMVSERLGVLGSPRVYFQGVKMNSCLNDYVSWLKGGGTNRWSNLAVGEAFARVLTGRDVSVHLAMPAADTAEEAWEQAPLLPPPLDVIAPDRLERIRSAVLHGMGRSLTVGTAGKAGRALTSWADDLAARHGIRVGFYAKTGSTERERSLLSGWETATGEPVFVQESEEQANLVLLIAGCEQPPEGSPYELQSLACRTPAISDGNAPALVVFLWIEDLGKSSQAVSFLAEAAQAKPTAIGRLFRELGVHLAHGKQR